MNFRYWTVSNHFEDRIVVEWTQPDGTVERTEGINCERRDYFKVSWMYGKPPDEIEETVDRIFASKNEYTGADAEYMGELRLADVDDFVCAVGSEVA